MEEMVNASEGRLELGMPRLSPATGLLCFLLLSATPASATAQLPACRPVDSNTVAFLGDLTYFATAPSSNSYAAEHRTLKGLPVADSAQVIVVSDSTTCSHARAAYATVLGLNPTSVSVIVVKVADRYAVVDPSAHVGEWKLAKTFDSVFVKIKDFAW
jgi:hypothetical protein